MYHNGIIIGSDDADSAPCQFKFGNIEFVFGNKVFCPFTQLLYGFGQMVNAVNGNAQVFKLIAIISVKVTRFRPPLVRRCILEYMAFLESGRIK